MTWKQWTINQLTERGMFPKDAETVFDLIKADKVNESMTDRWNDSVEGYPPQMKAVCLMVAKTIALEWIDMNQPQAWFREMFV